MDAPPLLPPLPANSAGGDRALAVLCHVSFFLGVGFILPLIVYLVKRTECSFTSTHAREVLNFHLSLIIYCLVTIPFVFLLIGIPVFIALGLMSVICAIIGAVRASEGGYYRYPLTIHFIN